LCANGDGNPVYHPSRVICEECLNKMTAKLLAMTKKMEDNKNETPKE
jgi:hypothetical protein